MKPADIVALRKHLGLTQTEFAEVLQVAFSTVNRWERGHATPCERLIRTLRKLEEKDPIVDVDLKKDAKGRLRLYVTVYIDGLRKTKTFAPTAERMLAVVDHFKNHRHEKIVAWFR